MAAGGPPAMNHDDLRDWSKRAADWAHDYHTGLRDRPVRAPLTPWALSRQLPDFAPENPEPVEQVFADFARLVPPAMTHWQHPRFFAYFPANAAPASMLAEQLANAIAAQGMLWQTAPAATEMEVTVLKWLSQAIGLQSHFQGTIHDSATTATLSAILSMREQALGWQGNAEGLSGHPSLRLYASAETHSSVDKAARIAGIGQANLVKIPTDDTLALRPSELDAAIRTDRSAGLKPAGVILCAGGTSVGAFDRIRDSLAVAKSHALPVHVDAAWAGSAMICNEFRYLWDGVEDADSLVINPHKWLGAQFDCAVQFLADPSAQVRTLTMKPAYLATPNTAEPPPPDFNDWTVPLGRRFRALKLWFLVRTEGLAGLRSRIRNHVAWAREAHDMLARIDGIEITTAPSLSLFTFCCKTDAQTQSLLDRINNDGRIYLTPTRHRGRLVIRVQVGQFDCTRDDVMMIPNVVNDLL
jgi:aromatic-L-amino-acid decarboxylase